MSLWDDFKPAPRPEVLQQSATNFDLHYPSRRMIGDPFNHPQN